MNPVQITETLRESMIRYLLTTFDVNRDGQEPELRAALREKFGARGALFNGPFLELTMPYVTGSSLIELAAEQVIQKQLLNLDCFKQGKPLWPDTPLYLHQETAIRKLCGDQSNIIVSSGTGSGKTECFLVPILNDLLKDPSPGVRAVIIYPLNALVNDQLERLRSLLSGTDITFGRYTGELPQKKADALRNYPDQPLPNEVICRDEIQLEGKIPQILITNYAMLEYLLLRPVDAPLFNSGAWRFIVLDEAHTHAGAQGIEVGFLIRRLRHRLGLGPEDTRCIATSATLTDDSASEAAKFASALFGVPFNDEDVIFGQVKHDDQAPTSFEVQPNTYLSEEFVQLVNSFRQISPSSVDIALLLDELGLIEAGTLARIDEFNDRPQTLLWHALRSNRDLHLLKDLMAGIGGPIEVERAAREVFGDRLADVDREQALFHLIELGAIARRDDDEPPLLPAKYHLFSRPPQGIWVCLNPGCPGRDHGGETNWSRIFPTRRENCDSCGKAVYPLYICRTCGQRYIRALRDQQRFLAEADPILETEANYFTWRLLDENPSLADIELDEELEFEDNRSKENSTFRQEEFQLCVNCRQSAASCTCDGNEKALIRLFRVNEVEKSAKGVRNKPVSHMNECPRCHDKGFQDREIATPISQFSTTPLSILTNELYRLLPVSTSPEIAKKPGQGRKLLSFYDSRQGAARFAAFLQDAVNDQVYRYIIPEAIRQLEEQTRRFPDIEEVSDRCFKIAWDFRVFHNDPTFSDELGRTQRPSGAQRDRLKLKFMEQIIAELTTRRRGRQSLESIGLVAVEYFEPGYEPDFSTLARDIGLDEMRTRTIVEYLLDGLRNQKIVALPEGVNRDSEVFGRNKFSPRLVRSKAQKYEIAWIGETERQHRRQMLQQILMEEGRAADDETIIGILSAIFDWFVNDTDLFDGLASEGYQLAYNRLFLTTKSDWYQCDHCRRLSSRGGGGLICPQHTCSGSLSKTDVVDLLGENFYREIFSRELIPMRVEEHTAQLDSDKGRKYQEEFKNGNINVLSCSTTFEMGIDLGDLQGVVLSNIPPTVANYKQRAGRAGRRASGTAFILSWASDRPHDQTYYTAPIQIISGQVRVPHLATNNEFILQRHINAILFSAFMRFRKSEGHDNLSQVGPFFDPQSAQHPHYDSMETWLTSYAGQIDHSLEAFQEYLGGRNYQIEGWKKEFLGAFRAKGKQHYSEVTEYYNQEIKHATAKIQELFYTDELGEITKRYGKLLTRLRDDDLIDYLSSRGVLPSYSFPLHTVELEIHPDKKRGLRLQRDLRQAIREYAPGQEVIADKRIWKSVGLTFYRESPKLFYYRICENCNHLQIGMDAGVTIPGIDGPCPLCNEPPSRNRKRQYSYIEPDGFRTSKDSGMPAGQYVEREQNLMRSALIPMEPDDIQLLGNILEAGYSREGRLLYVNEGNLGIGFKICLKCGTRVRGKQIKCINRFRGEPCPGRLEYLTLGFQEVTDTLRLSFQSLPDLDVPNPEDKSFWLSLMYSLLQGASRALQIERRDIDGVLFPKQVEKGRWQQTIVLFDSVPGGAGHVKQVRQELSKVIQEALRIANCVNCAPETSCVQCLRDYNNQFDYHLLARGPVVRFLEGVLASLLSSDDPSQANPVVALNYPRWLMQTVGRTQQKVIIVADSLSLTPPAGEIYHWLDVLNNLLKRNVEVVLRLGIPLKVTLEDPETLSVARYLQLMIEGGLKLDLIDTIPEWRILIDPDSIESCRALKPNESPFLLDDRTGENGLTTITHRNVVFDIFQEIESIPGRIIGIDDLKQPENVRVLNIDSSIGKITEEELFGDVFAETIVELRVNDRYLNDHYRIVDRLSAYIRMASKGKRLKNVVVYTWDANRSGSGNNSREEQNRGIERLIKEFPEVNIQFKRTMDTPHDREIILIRENGRSARIMIGKGLDFIKKDGTPERTYVVIQDPIIDHVS